MENEKYSRYKVYGIVIAILISLVAIFFIFRSTNWNAVRCHTAYVIIKDHGSLIGGILAIIGVGLMIRNQDKSTEQTVKATLKAIHLESREIERRNDKRCILKIITESSSMVDVAQSDLRNLTYQYCHSYLKGIKENAQELIFSDFKEGNSVACFIESFALFCQDLLKYQSGMSSTSKEEHIHHMEKLKSISLRCLDNVAKEAGELLEKNSKKSIKVLVATEEIQKCLRSISFELYPVGHENTNLLHSSTLQNLHKILVKHDIYAVWLLELKRQTISL